MEVTEIPSQYWLAGHNAALTEIMAILLDAVQTRPFVTSAIYPQLAADFPFETLPLLLVQRRVFPTVDHQNEFMQGVLDALDVFRKATGGGDGSQGSRV